MESSNKQSVETGEIIDYTPASEQEAWIGVLYACANADDYISNTEIDKFTHAIGYKKLFDHVDMVALFENIAEVGPKLDNHQLMEICARKVSREMRPTLFSIAVELVIADGMLMEDEEALIKSLRLALDIETDLAQKIIDVMHIRYRGNVKVSDEEDEYDDLDEEP